MSRKSTHYGLDKHPPKSHVLQSCLPTCGATGRWWNLYEVEFSDRKLGHWGMALNGSPSSLPGHHEVNSFPHHVLLPRCFGLPQVQSNGIN